MNTNSKHFASKLVRDLKEHGTVGQYNPELELWTAGKKSPVATGSENDESQTTTNHTTSTNPSAGDTYSYGYNTSYYYTGTC